MSNSRETCDPINVNMHRHNIRNETNIGNAIWGNLDGQSMATDLLNLQGVFDVKFLVTRPYNYMGTNIT